MGNPAQLSTLVKTLLGGATSQRLRELTNQSDNAATTIDEDVLLEACRYAIGVFDQRSGILSDTDTPNYGHMLVLLSGVFFVLENSAGRDVGFVAQNAKDFFAGCGQIRKLAYQAPRTRNNLKKSVQRSGAKPDMDRLRLAFRNRRTAGLGSLVREFNDDFFEGG